MRAMVIQRHGGPEELQPAERPVPEPGEHQLSRRGARHLDALLYRSLTIHHEFVGARLAFDVDPGHHGAILTSLARLVDGGLLRPHVSARLPLADVAEGHRRIETGRTIGKMTLLVR